MEARKVKWDIDPAHSEIAFRVEQFSSTYVKGVFRHFKAIIFCNGLNPAICQIELIIDPASVQTGVAERDNHLKSADFFDVDNFNQITFSGYTTQKTQHASGLELNGYLTIKGIARQIKMDVYPPGIRTDGDFSINGVINRGDWGLNWNTALQSGGLLIDDEIRIGCIIHLKSDKGV